MNTLDDFLRPAAFAKRYADTVGSESRLRYLLRFRDSNGLVEHGAVVQRGRQLFISVSKFRDWLVGDHHRNGTERSK